MQSPLARLIMSYLVRLLKCSSCKQKKSSVKNADAGSIGLLTAENLNRHLQANRRLTSVLNRLSIGVNGTYKKCQIAARKWALTRSSTYEQVSALNTSAYGNFLNLQFEGIYACSL